MWNMKTKDPKPEHVINVMAAVSAEYVFKIASRISETEDVPAREFTHYWNPILISH